MPKPSKLFVEKMIEIGAPPARVWQALTRRDFTDEWAREFSSGGPRFHIESEWRLKSPVEWKGADGRVVVEGSVTALEPDRLLRFTVFDTRSAERPRLTEEDGITFLLEENGGGTVLHLRHGDFSVLAEGQKYRDMSAKIWDRVLPRIKDLAESAERLEVDK